MNELRQRGLQPFTFWLLAGLVSCDQFHVSGQTAKTAVASTPTPLAKDLAKKMPDILPTPRFVISSSGIGPIRLGMPLGEARKAVPDAMFKRSSDGDGVALIDVLFGEEAVVTLYADEDDPEKPIDWSKKITAIESFNSACATSVGIRVGTSIFEAEKAYGKIKSIVKSEIESREYIEFQNQPEHLAFRIDYTGIYPEGAHETTRFDPKGKIFSIAVSSRQ